MLWENIQCHWTNVGLQRLILMVSTIPMTLEMLVIDLKWPQLTPDKISKIMKNDPKLRVIFFFGMNSVLNFHGLDLLHSKMLISQLMVKLQPTILVNTGIQMVKFKLFISVNSDGLLMVMMKERSPKVNFYSVSWAVGPVRISVQTRTNCSADQGPFWILLKFTIIALSRSVNKLKVTPVPSTNWTQVSFLLSRMTSSWRNTYIIFKMRKLHVLLSHTQLHHENDDHWLNHKKQAFQLAFKSNQSTLPIAPISVPTIPSVTETDFFIFFKINFYNFRN